MKPILLETSIWGFVKTCTFYVEKKRIEDEMYQTLRIVWLAGGAVHVQCGLARQNSISEMFGRPALEVRLCLSLHYVEVKNDTFVF